MKVQVTLLIRPDAHNIDRYRRIPIGREIIGTISLPRRTSRRRARGRKRKVDLVDPDTLPVNTFNAGAAKSLSHLFASQHLIPG